jgi:hypothetical protein
MIRKQITVESRTIDVIDDAFSLAEKDHIYDYAVNSPYKLSRLSSEIPSQRSYPTLKCNVSISELIRLGFFNKSMLSIIKDAELRVLQAYINLGTCSDRYFYHIDSTHGKDKTMLYYVNLDWRQEWEGETHFSNESLTDIVHSSAFIPGRTVLFDATLPHKTSQPSYGAEVFRYCLVIKLADAGSQTYSQAVEISDFQFKEFATTEYENKAIEFIRSITENISHSQSTFYLHCLNTYRLLRSQGRSQDVCLAGLYHSVYGTEFYNPQINITRELVQSYIGNSAEHLVKLFCDANPRQDIVLNNVLNYDQATHQNLLYIEYANLIDQYLRTGQYFDTIKLIRNKLDYING